MMNIKSRTSGQSWKVVRIAEKSDGNISTRVLSVNIEWIGKVWLGWPSQMKRMIG